MIRSVPNINEFDLALIVDSTGSMGNLIKSAQRQLIEIVDSLAAESNVAMHVGVVEYRDYPPQDSMPSRSFRFTDNLKKVRRTINGLRASGGGDAPEAVFAGLAAAWTSLQWREHARRVALLVGDAPPHGVGAAGDGFPHGCPSGQTMHSITAQAEVLGVTLYALGLSRSCERAFTQLSQLTGGRCLDSHDGDSAMEQLRKILQEEFGQLELDREVQATWLYMTEPNIERLGALMKQPESTIAKSVNRLRQRGLLKSAMNEE